MPHLVPKSTALNELEQTGFTPERCLICRLVKETTLTIFEDEYTIVFLSEYPRFWGHTIVSLKRHVERFSDLNEIEYGYLFENARKAAITIEKALNPVRTYVASIGAAENKINTCPHIHVNVLPIYEKDVKPSQVFTWENGVYMGTEIEWEELKNTMKNGMSA
jgi:diadenosine tetraphosphate (Ap4A) HIT family hydrolase